MDKVGRINSAGFETLLDTLALQTTADMETCKAASMSSDEPVALKAFV